MSVCPTSRFPVTYDGIPLVNADANLLDKKSLLFFTITVHKV